MLRTCFYIQKFSVTGISIFFNSRLKIRSCFKVLISRILFQSSHSQVYIQLFRRTANRLCWSQHELCSLQLHAENGQSAELGLLCAHAGALLFRLSFFFQTLLFQNHDVIGKSIYQISRIFELLDGANDIEIDKEFGRIDKTFRWDLRTLKLFRDESSFSEGFLNRSLTNFKGSVQGSLSRKAVEWMVRVVNPFVFMDQWNDGVRLL